MATLTYTNFNTTHTLTILPTTTTTTIYFTSTEFGTEVGEVGSAGELAGLFRIPVAKVRKALKG